MHRELRISQLRIANWVDYREKWGKSEEKIGKKERDVVGLILGIFPESSAFTANEVATFNSWLYLTKIGQREIVGYNSDQLPEGAAAKLEDYWHHRAHHDQHLLFGKTKDDPAVKNHRQKANESSSQFQAMTGYNAERLYNYIQSLSTEAQARSISLRKLVEKRSIKVIES